MAMTYHLDVVSAEQQMFSGLVEKSRLRVAKANWGFTRGTRRCSPPLSLV